MKTAAVLCLLLLGYTAYTQTYNFTTFSNEVTGSSFIYGFAQDNEGVLYIATSHGIVSYDGHDYNHISNALALKDPFISTIHIDHQNTLWLGYYRGGVSLIKDKKITTFDTDFVVNHFEETSGGEILICSDEGVYHVERDELVELKTQTNILQLSIIKPNHYFFIDNGLNLYNIYNGQERLMATGTMRYSIDKANRKLATIEEEELIIYTYSDSTIANEVQRIDLTDFLANNTINSIDFSEESVILGSGEKGIVEIIFNSNFTAYEILFFSEENGLPSEIVQCTFTDREGNLWVGSYGKGVAMLPKNRVSVNAQSGDIASDNINCIVEFEGEILLGTDHGIRTVQDSSGKPFLLSGTSINTFKINEDKLWIGTKEKGLFYYSNGLLNSFEIDLGGHAPTTYNCIQFEGTTLMAGTNQGLLIHYPDSGKTKLITTNEGLVHNVIEHFIIDQQRRFWFDSPNSPICSYSNGEFSYHKNISGFEAYNLTDIYEISNGSILFTTAGDGVFVYENDSFKQYTTDDGLLSDYVYWVQETSDSIVFTGHKGGISIMENHTSAQMFKSISGIKELEYINPGASQVILQKKQIRIGTSDGLVSIPNLSTYNKIVFPKLSLSTVEINKRSYPVTKTIHLPYDNYFVDFKFNTVYLSNPELIQCEYKLDGFDKKWNAVSNTKKHARYQRLKDGKYLFRIRLRLDENTTTQEHKLLIHIDLPFWKKVWFFLFCFVFIMILFIVILAIAMHRNRKLRKVLASKVEKRTREIVDKNKKIKEINKNLELMSAEYFEAKEIAELKTKEIERSIRYAEHIQKVTFRKQEYAEWLTIFQDMFLIFKPKDIVSGDFYWGAKTEDYYYISVGDCTGHGVPGALISMLGVSILSDITPLQIETNLILDNLRERIITELGQDKMDTRLYDGIDISLIKFDPKTKKVQFSGAYNPLYIIRHKSINTREREILKIVMEKKDLIVYTTIPDRQPAGYHSNIEPFTACEIQLFEGDELYLFSDGYMDQFGGPRNKKFSRKRFADTLLELHGLPGDVQKKQLWSILTNWQGNAEQVDDISILCLRI